MIYHICWFKQTSSPGWRGWEQKDKGQDSGPFEVHGKAAIDFSEARILDRAFLQNQHLCHIFNMDATDKDQKEGNTVPSAVVPSQANHCFAKTWLWQERNSYLFKGGPWPQSWLNHSSEKQS